jgi:hypothetical protein
MNLFLTGVSGVDHLQLGPATFSVAVIDEVAVRSSEYY